AGVARRAVEDLAEPAEVEVHQRVVHTGLPPLEAQRQVARRAAGKVRARERLPGTRARARDRLGEALLVPLVPLEPAHFDSILESRAAAHRPGDLVVEGSSGGGVGLAAPPRSWRTMLDSRRKKPSVCSESASFR